MSMTDEMVQRLRTRAGRARADRAAIVDQARRERRGDDSLTAAEDTEFRAKTEEINELELRVDEILEQDRRQRHANAATARSAAGWSGHDRGTYAPGNNVSYLRDLVSLARGVSDPEARDRLQQHGLEMRDLNRTDGSGGAFTPPAFLLSDFIGLPRPGRVTADLLDRKALPPGTDSINIPKIQTGTSTAIQPADNDPVQEVDLTDSTATAAVRTIAGQQDVAIQLLDQSPVNFDEIILRDLLADYSQKLNSQVLSGSGALGQLLGLRNVVGSETVTWTSAAPTVAELVKRIADAASRISSATYNSPNAVIMHPRRWAWLTSQTDSTGRPLIVPTGAGPSNALGLVGTGAAEGRVGQLNGLDVYVDGGLPTNLGAGVNQDIILVLDAADSILFESGIRTRVMPETLSGTLTVRIQLYAYSALITRQAKSIAQISGTGLTPPSFV